MAITGTRGSCAATARSSGARRSPAGVISAQWNGALTFSGITRLAPSALAHSPARATAALLPAITICPAPLRFAGLTTSPCAAVGTRLRAHAAFVEAEDGGHRARPDRHGLLHVAAAVPDQAHGVGEIQRAGRHVRGVLAQAVAGDECGRQPSLGEHAAMRRCWR